MVVNDEFKYFGKIIKNRNRSIITNNGTVAFLKHRDDSSLFPQRREIIIIIIIIINTAPQ
jgi:hypothetical protein